MPEEKKIIYVAGKVTGLAYGQVYAKFRAAQLELEAQGFTVVNPCEIVPEAVTDWQTAMRICVAAICGCDTIYLLPDWYLSKGAKIERDIAMMLGLSLIEP